MTRTGPRSPRGFELLESQGVFSIGRFGGGNTLYEEAILEGLTPPKKSSAVTKFIRPKRLIPYDEESPKVLKLIHENMS